jgi:hypothetical protein
LHGLVRIGRARTFFAIPPPRRACQQKATVSSPVRAKKCIARHARIDRQQKNRRGIAAAAVDDDVGVAR